MTTFQTLKLTHEARWREMLVSLIVTLLIFASATLPLPASAEAAPSYNTTAPVQAQKDRPLQATANSSDLADDFLGQDSTVGGTQTQRRTNTGASDSNWIIPAIVLIVAWAAVGIDMVQTERRQAGPTDPNQ